MASPDTPEKQKEFAASRNWTFDMISTAGTSFTKDVGFDGTMADGKPWIRPGFSTYYKNDDGTITKVSDASFYPGDDYNFTWHFFKYLKEGVNNWQPQYSYPKDSKD